MESVLIAFLMPIQRTCYENFMKTVLNPLTCISKHIVMWKTIVQPPIDAVARIILVNLLAQDLSIGLDFSLFQDQSHSYLILLIFPTPYLQCNIICLFHPKSFLRLRIHQICSKLLLHVLESEMIIQICFL